MSQVTPTTWDHTCLLFGEGQPAPAAHGFLGFMQHVPQMGAICDMIFFRAGLSERTGELLDWGLDPLTLTPAPGTAEWLARAGIPTTALIGQNILKSPLSNLHY